ncbi:MAG: PLP-dependent aminotransferase family protein [Caldilineaceae bacterium]|nr:PLP-dependent aminotransferase family protein [Caldilineaceae bacterium]
MTTIRTTQIQVPEGVIDLGVGQPAEAILPLVPLRQAAEHWFAQGNPTLLQYGLEEGDGYFQQTLATFLQGEYGIAVTPEQLFVTNGVSQALDLICTLLTKPGDLVLVEEATYFLAFGIFRDHGLRVETVPMDSEGIDVAALEAKVQQERPVLLYTIPTFQNPTSITLSASRRAALVALSRHYHFWIVADEVYHLLSYGQRPPLPFAHYIEAGPVISLGTFSKILAPGLRLGWLQAAPTVVERFMDSGLVRSGGGLNPFVSGVVRSAIELGLQAHYLAGLRRLYGERIQALDQALRTHLPPWVEFTPPHGGYFFWLKLPAAMDAQALLPKADAHQVGFRAGNKFSTTGGLSNYLRLCFAYYDRAQLVEGAARLGAVLGE